MQLSNIRLSNIRQRVAVRLNPFHAFLHPEAKAINAARLDHLASLGLPLHDRRVLEVGAGIGLLTEFFIDRGCSVLSTDARSENVAEMRRRYPAREVTQLDLERADDVAAAGTFDIAYCYGTLYHLSNPEIVLRALAQVSSMLLLETCCTPGDTEDVNIVLEDLAVKNQASSGLGCRPTRPWVLRRVRDLWGHAYVPITQPSHREFPLVWSDLPREVRPTDNTRAIFVGSRPPLDSALLTEDLPDVQLRVAAGGTT